MPLWVAVVVSRCDECGVVLVGRSVEDGVVVPGAVAEPRSQRTWMQLALGLPRTCAALAEAGEDPTLPVRAHASFSIWNCKTVVSVAFPFPTADTSHTGQPPSLQGLFLIS